MLIVMGQTGTRTLHKAGSYSVHDDEIPAERKRLIDALSELHNLLEDYAPSWYTEEYHRKVESVLHTRKKH